MKCATITPNAGPHGGVRFKTDVEESNGTIRAILDGTVFRVPIIVKGIEPYVKNWKKPITVARHAYGDVYKAAEMRIPGTRNVSLYLPVRMEPSCARLSMTSKREAWYRACTIWRAPSKAFPEAAFPTRFPEAGSVVCHQGYDFQEI